MKEVQDRAVHPNVRDMYEDNALTPILKKRILVMFWMYWMLAVVTDVMSEFYATGEIVVMFWRCRFSKMVQHLLARSCAGGCLVVSCAFMH